MTSSFKRKIWKMHTDWYDANVTSLVVSDKAGKKNHKAGNHIISWYNEPAKKAYKRLQEGSKINNTTQGKGKEITLYQSQR